MGMAHFTFAQQSLASLSPTYQKIELPKVNHRNTLEKSVPVAPQPQSEIPVFTGDDAAEWASYEAVFYSPQAKEEDLLMSYIQVSNSQAPAPARKSQVVSARDNQ